MRVALLVTLLASFAAAQARSKADLVKAHKQRKIERFFKKVEAMELDATAKERLARLKETGILGGEYGCIHRALLQLHPLYKRADALLLGDRFAAAAEQFDVLRTADDEYVRAYATFRYGLAQMNRERFDSAATAFTDVLNKHRFAGCDIECAFYLAVCLGQNREKEKAIVAAQRFLDDYPDAPDRYRQAMEQMKNELIQGWESPLYDLSGRMQHVARRIESGETGDPTQNDQKEIVRIIEELIKKAEDNEGQGQGDSKGGGGRPRGNDPSSSPANKSSAPRGATKVGNLRPRPKRKPGAKWGEMRDKEREEVLQALKEKIPERYRELEEQYKKALAEGKRVTEPTEEAAGGK